MNLTEMHSLFRQFAQQMGMQNTRAILPEQIDMCINTSITDTINQLISQNILNTNDRVITDNSKIGQVNAFSTLYKVFEANAEPNYFTSSYTLSSDEDTANPPIKPDIPPISGGDLIDYKSFTYGNETFIKRIWSPIDKLCEHGVKGEPNSPQLNYLFLIDLSINYKIKDNRVTNYFPVRLIDDAYLSDTLNDFILRPRLRTPIAVIYNNQLDIYIDEQSIIDNSKLTPNTLRISYIKAPAKVKYVKDFGEDNTDCDLPEYLHVDIVKHAVDLWRIAVSGSIHANKQQEQAQQQEVARNNYRNEGNQR